MLLLVWRDRGVALDRLPAESLETGVVSALTGRLASSGDGPDSAVSTNSSGNVGTSVVPGATVMVKTGWRGAVEAEVEVVAVAASSCAAAAPAMMVVVGLQTAVDGFVESNGDWASSALLSDADDGEKKLADGMALISFVSSSGKREGPAWRRGRPRRSSAAVVVVSIVAKLLVLRRWSH